MRIRNKFRNRLNETQWIQLAGRVLTKWHGGKPEDQSLRKLATVLDLDLVHLEAFLKGHGLSRGQRQRVEAWLKGENFQRPTLSSKEWQTRHRQRKAEEKETRTRNHEKLLAGHRAAKKVAPTETLSA